MKRDPTRRQTDEGLRAEREQSDSEFSRRRVAADADTESRIQLAREKAAAALRAARALEDDTMSSENASDDARRSVVHGRDREDRVRDEREQADDDVRAKGRAEQEQSLAELVATERERTDQHLLHERVRADQLIQARDDFLGTISHDLRSLLGNVSTGAYGIIQSLRQGLDEDATAAAEIIQRSATVMGLLIRDLMDTVALNAGLLTVARIPCDARTLVAEARDAFERIAAAKGISLLVTAPDTPLLASLDPVRIFQVLSNLVTNSIRHTPAGGTIEISLVADGSFIQFAVKDSGAGIPPTVIDSLFDRSARQPTPGHLGLGLFIAQGLVASHGGRIWAENNPGPGATVYFTVPAQAR